MYLICLSTPSLVDSVRVQQGCCAPTRTLRGVAERNGWEIVNEYTDEGHALGSFLLDLPLLELNEAGPGV